MNLALLIPRVGAYLSDRAGEIDQIPSERRERLKGISAYIRDQRAAGKHARLIFVCTHNSRRSHMAQLWAAAAAGAYGIALETFSGGTEATAFHPHAVEAMRRAGFEIETTSAEVNPVYHVRYGPALPTLSCFSKVYDQPPNPREGFAAVMVCTEADAACPLVAGATGRFTLPYVDPKAADGSHKEAATYDERCRQIAREMLWMMGTVDG